MDRRLNRGCLPSLSSAIGLSDGPGHGRAIVLPNGRAVALQLADCSQRRRHCSFDRRRLPHLGNAIRLGNGRGDRLCNLLRGRAG